MNVHVSYKAGKTPEVEREFQHQVQRLGRRLHVFKPDLIHLHALVNQERSRSINWSLNLRLPSGQLVVQHSGDNGVSAVKAAFADLVAQVTKHKELLRGDWSRAQRVAKIEIPEPPRTRKAPAAAPASARNAEQEKANGLENWISVNLPRLRQFVDAELQVRAANGQIREDQVTSEEVIDEVMVSALSHEDGRAALLTPESWFHRLALQAIRHLIKSNADTGDLSLDAPARMQNVSGSDENLLQYHQPDDRLQEENVIRDDNVRTPEQIFSDEEMVSQLDLILQEVKTADREAFVLYTLEGFTVEEISRLASRPAEQVRKSIQHARERIQQHLPEENEYRKSLLRRSRVA
ncbi:MAG TPA: sigma-70 family RNA polymerase sigma factor [Candidatus Angelobacter sp.]|nr:sigma-70 family RNA polymerase sigma factor [Candidatus Angelobacter sp.]